MGVGRPVSARTSHLVFVVLVAAVAIVGVTAGRRPAALVATSTALAVIGWQVLTGNAPVRAWRAVLLGVAVLTVDAACSVVLPLVTGAPAPPPPTIFLRIRRPRRSSR